MSTAAQTMTPARLSLMGIGPKAAAVFGASLVGTAIRFAVQIFLVRWLPGAAYGSFVLARQWGELLAKLPDRGYALGSVRFVPRYLAAADMPRLRGLLDRAIRGTFIRSTVVLAAALFVNALLGNDLSIATGLTLAVVMALAAILRAVLQGSDAYAPATVLSELGQPVLMIAGFASLHYTGRLTVISALLAVFLSWLAVAGMEAVLLRLRLPHSVEEADPQYEDQEWTRSTQHLFVAQLGIAVINISDVLIVGATVGKLEAGIYAIATRIAAIGRISNAAVESLVSPRIAASANDGAEGLAAIQSTIDRAIRISLGPSVLFAIGAIVAATPVLELIGKDFGGGRGVLIVLVLSNLADAVSGPSGHVVSLVGSEKKYSRIMIANAVLLLVLAIPGGIAFGIMGVAFARTAVNVSWNAALFAEARRAFGLWCLPSRRTLQLRG